MTDPNATYGYFPGTGIPRKRPPYAHDGPGVCRNCGEPGLTWEKIDGTWRLVSVGGKEHVCNLGRVK